MNRGSGPDPRIRTKAQGGRQRDNSRTANRARTARDWRGRLGRHDLLPPRTVGVPLPGFAKKQEMKSSSEDQNNPLRLRLMNIQQPASSQRLYPSPAQLGDCACVAGARFCRHTCAPPPPAREAGKVLWRVPQPPRCARRGLRKSRRRSSSLRMRRRSRSSSWSGS